MGKNNEIKEVKESNLLIKKIVDIQEDQFGRKIVRFKWVAPQKNVSLGSVANPNKEILEYKFEVPQKRSGLFGGLLGD